MSDAPGYNPLAELLTVSAAATALAVSENTVYRMILDGRLAALRHGGKSWITKDEIGDYLARQRAESVKVRDARAKTRRSGDRPRSIKDQPSAVNRSRRETDSA
jgi:excisionase family DNA binding protein